MGIIPVTPSFLFDSKDKLDYLADLGGVMTWRGMCENYKVSDELPMALYKIGIKYNYEIGSESSMDLHIALSEVKDLNVYNSEAILKLIEYKWRKLSWFVQG